MITLTTVELPFLAGVQSFFYTADGMAPDYIFRSLSFDHVGGVILFRLPAPLVNALSSFEFYKVVKRKRMGMVLVALAHHHVTKIDWPSSGGSGDFAFYNFAMSTVQAGLADKIALVSHQKVNEGLVLFFLSTCYRC